MKTSLVLFAVLALAGTAMAGDGCCQPAQCPPTKKVCIGTVGEKEVTKNYYECKCVDFCLPKCALKCGHKGHGKDCCGGCAQPCDGVCADCEMPRTRTVLIKRSRKVKECEIKCEVQEILCQDHCAAPSGTVIYQGQPTMSAPAVETAPMPGVKK
jgi:hypothetical protein